MWHKGKAGLKIDKAKLQLKKGLKRSYRAPTRCDCGFVDKIVCGVCILHKDGIAMFRASATTSSFSRITINRLIFAFV